MAFGLCPFSCSAWSRRIVLVALLLGRSGVLAAGDVHGSACRAPACQEDARAPSVLSFCWPSCQARLTSGGRVSALRLGAWKKSSVTSLVRADPPGELGLLLEVTARDVEQELLPLVGPAFGLAVPPKALAAPPGPLLWQAAPSCFQRGLLGRDGLSHGN